MKRGPEPPTVEIRGRDVAYQGFFRMERYRLRHRLFDGGMSAELTRELFERGHAAAVLPYDPVREAVLLLEQFRIGALEAPGGPWLLEIVAGIIEPGESAAAVAEREALEEAGCPVTDLVPIADYLVSPGGTSERISLFCGRVDISAAPTRGGLAQEHEDIRVHAVPLADALALLAQGAINSAAPIIALQWLAAHREVLHRRWGLE